MLLSEMYQQVYDNARRITKTRCRIYLILEPNVVGFIVRFDGQLLSKKVFKKLAKSFRGFGKTIIEEDLDSEGNVVNRSLRVIRRES